jgi:predicted RNase H-like nuclease
MTSEVGLAHAGFQNFMVLHAQTRLRQLLPRKSDFTRSAIFTNHPSMLIIGIDLAWGEKKSDGVCFVDAHRSSARVRGFAYPRGDDELLDCLRAAVNDSKEVFITIDGPIICPNKTGTRPVDRLTHRLFHREHAACHPANSTKCPRPPRILRKLKRIGFTPGWKIKRGMKIAAEVYPHPAMVRLFKLPRIVKYKKGSVANRRQEFRRLQFLLRKLLRSEFAFLRLNAEAKALLREPWSKPVEDQTDALFCALIGLWHARHYGRRSEVIGDLRTGFILLPEDLREV